MTTSIELLPATQAIAGRIQQLESELDALRRCVRVLADLDEFQATRTVGAVIDRPESKPAPRVSSPRKPKPDGLKRCQACRKMRPESEFGEGPQRPKRRCNACEAGTSSPEKSVSRTPATPGMVYSKPHRCPKCQHPAARFQRRADATVSGFWTCLENHCELRIGNYTIPIDRNYSGGGAA